MKQEKWLRLSIFLAATVLLSGCVVEPFGDHRGDDRRDHDRGDQRDHERGNQGEHEGEH